MTATTYKGDSPGKKIQRLRTWLHMWALGQAFRTPYEGALVLGGHGGDVDVLEGLGFPAHSVTAVDRDPACLRICKERHPQIRTVCGDVGGAAGNALYSMAHIDFCANFSVETLRTLTHVMRGFDSFPGILAVTLLKGRERKSRTSLMGHLSRSVRRDFRQSRKKKLKKGKDKLFHEIAYEATDGRGFDPKTIMRLAERICQKEGRLTGYCDKAMIRQIALTETLFNLGLAESIQIRKDAGDKAFYQSLRMIQPVGIMEYHSRTEADWGTPFMTAFFVVGRRCDMDFIGKIREERAFLVNARDPMSMQECTTALKPSAVEISRWVGVERAARIFDVDPKTLIAWKAHDSRGTYGPSVFGEAAVIDVPEEAHDAIGLDINGPVQVGRALG